MPPEYAGQSPNLLAARKPIPGSHRRPARSSARIVTMPRPYVTIGRRAGGADRPTSDRVGGGHNTVIVLDGGAALGGGGSRGGWCARSLGQTLARMLTARDVDAREGLHDAIAALVSGHGLMPGQSSEAAVAILRCPVAGRSRFPVTPTSPADSACIDIGKDPAAVATQPNPYRQMVNHLKDLARALEQAGITAHVCADSGSRAVLAVNYLSGYITCWTNPADGHRSWWFFRDNAPIAAANDCQTAVEQITAIKETWATR